jgi:fatty acid desaturase
MSAPAGPAPSPESWPKPEIEPQIELWLRRQRGLVPAINLLVLALLFAGLGACLRGFEIVGAQLGFVAVVVAGLLAHAILIIVVHDGAHRALTRSAADGYLMNIGAGLLLVPFFAEPFRRYHLIHHAHTNQPGDPLWPPFKRHLFDRHRRLYLIAELVPLLFSILALVFPAPQTAARPLPGPPVRWRFVALSFAVAIVTAWWVQPPLAFVGGTLLALNAWAALRHWCEHLGLDPDQQSNTFAFPLGMGVGNHAAHHDHPGYSWITMACGLRTRAKETNPLRTLVALVRHPEFRHYEAPR